MIFLNKTKRKPVLICGILALILISAVLIMSKMREGQGQKQEKKELVTGLDVSWMFDKEERRRMEETYWYDDLKFEKEVFGKDFITYEELKNQVETDNKTVGTTLELGRDAGYGGIWLKFMDVKYKDSNGNPRVFFVAKKPIINNVSWEELFNAGVVYGPDKINPDGSIKEDATEIDPSYKGKIIKIKKGKYIVRLMKGVSNDLSSAEHEAKTISFTKLDAIGSEWNRSIIPIIMENRGTDEFLEEKLGMFGNFKTYIYDWFGDLTIGASDFCVHGGYHEGSVGFKGQFSWCQEKSSEGDCFLRGSSLNAEAAAGVSLKKASSKDDSLGWRPVLELIEGEPFIQKDYFDYWNYK